MMITVKQKTSQVNIKCLRHMINFLISDMGDCCKISTMMALGVVAIFPVSARNHVL